MNELAPLTVAVARIEPSVSIDVIADAMGKIDTIKRAVRELDAELERVTLEWIASNGSFEIGTKRYYAGVNKETNPRDHVLAVVIFLETLGMTPTAEQATTLAELLCSGPWKMKPARALLGERFDEVFETVEKPELREGKPVKKLLTHDSRFG